MPGDTLLTLSGTLGRASACESVRETSGNVLLAVPLRHNGSPIQRIRLFYLWPFFMTIGLALWRDCPLMAVGDHTSVRISTASTGRASAREPSLAHSRPAAPSPTSSTPPRRGPAVPEARGGIENERRATVRMVGLCEGQTSYPWNSAAFAPDQGYVGVQR
jgi:hypothetical protein